MENSRVINKCECVGKNQLGWEVPDKNQLRDGKCQINLVSVFAVALPYATVIPPVTCLSLTLNPPEKTILLYISHSHPSTPLSHNISHNILTRVQQTILLCHTRGNVLKTFATTSSSKEVVLGRHN